MYKLTFMTFSGAFFSEWRFWLGKCTKKPCFSGKIQVTNLLKSGIMTTDLLQKINIWGNIIY